MIDDPSNQQVDYPDVRYKVLSQKTIWLAAIILALIGICMLTWLLLAYGRGDAQQRNQLEAIKVAGTIVVGTGGAAALLLAARRQRSTEIALRQKDLDQRDFTRSHALQEQIALASQEDATQRRITELYTKAVEQLGSAQAPVRLGGIYALDRLANENDDHRQTVVNVLCAYLRMPFTPPPQPKRNFPLKIKHSHTLRIQNTAKNENEHYQELQVRLTAQHVLIDHLVPRIDDTGQATNPKFWNDMDLDLTNATLVNWTLNDCAVRNAKFTGVKFFGETEMREGLFTGAALFDNSTFIDHVCFSKTTFNNVANFTDATFNGDAKFVEVTFANGASFDEASFIHNAKFNRTKFLNDAWFTGAYFARAAEFELANFKRIAAFGDTRFGSETRFDQVTFENATTFGDSVFAGYARFAGAIFYGHAWFREATFHKLTSFDLTMFADEAWFEGTEFSGEVWFRLTRFAGEASFNRAKFSKSVGFNNARIQRIDGNRSVWPTGWQVQPPKPDRSVLLDVDKNRDWGYLVKQDSNRP